ncbi:MAG: 2,3-bisphosphoglycerate-independent phosphoglycerate mutase [Candidatus Njordarchaeales archaeon]
MLPCILVIIDGLGDEYIPEFGGTPLQYLSDKLEVLNKLTREGAGGLMYPIAPGIPAGSDTAHLSIFGYDIKKEYPGRGFFEAVGAGIELKHGEVALRFNFATVKKVDNKLIILDRRAGRIRDDVAEELALFLQEKVEEAGLPVVIKHTLEHRGVMIIKPEKELSWRITDVDPHEKNAPVLASQPFQDTPPEEVEAAKYTANIVNQVVKLSFKVLDNHEINIERSKKGLLKANIILPRGAGKATRLISFKEKWGFKAAFVAGGPLYKGVAKVVGMEEIKVEGATGRTDTNLSGKVEGVLRALNMGYDFVFLHIKATDSLSHDKKPSQKAEFIAKIDKALSPLSELDDVVITVTGDHSTSSLRGRHIGTPLPIVFWADKIRRDNSKYFNEIEFAEKGAFGVIKGNDVLPILLDLADRVMEYGLRPSPKPVFYIGAPGKPLEI